MTARYRQEHYEDVAELLEDQLSSAPPLNWIGHIAETETNATVKRIASRFADLFAADNPLFNRGAFLATCGLES